MKLLFNRSSQALTHFTTDNSQANTATYIWESMQSKHTCPCCSYTLLCHIRLGGIYWRCGHCYQEMPALSIG
ncbi:MAG: hypothetical protein KME28_11025 [Pelatocladus maniniholoensis HA4357-MV3]|jgi:ribosomal protein L37AE/L43A|uniref:Uncharacterized protein n=1 Tax=Pelatocladus maniniholoensis HA4357-MV3 TaxID=1117104 RepID=A0A9E3LTH7_9NOST|nr:hypothetical protein [Pelatocladus maniniholoensis HA4357-MV3]BAZ66548.1 pentapeptide repeat protein [Fischerella sp. NIES-4106]